MPEQDSLSTIAEVAVGLAGFSGIAFALQRNPSPYYVLRAISIVALAVATIAVALLPTALSTAGIQPETIWRAGSGVSAITMLVLFALIAVYRRRATAEQRIAAIFLPVTLISLINGTTQLLNSMGFVWSGSFSVFYLGLVWNLVYCGIMFIVLVTIGRLERGRDEPAA